MHALHIYPTDSDRQNIYFANPTKSLASVMQVKSAQKVGVSTHESGTTFKGDLTNLSSLIVNHLIETSHKVYA